MYVTSVPEADKNFALEKYGDGSRCFDHTNDMWEERSCRQVRQWQHWGSGCYNYTCESGRLHIAVANYTYTCYHPGQEILVRIVSGIWLRKGAIRCPACRELCSKCHVPEEPVPSTQFPRDELACDTSHTHVSHTCIFVAFVVALLRISESHN